MGRLGSVMVTRTSPRSRASFSSRDTVERETPRWWAIASMVSDCTWYMRATRSSNSVLRSMALLQDVADAW